MDEAHLFHAMRYVSLNPVRARLVDRAEDWRCSSVRAHLAGKDNALVKVAPARDRYGDFAALLGASADDAQAWRALRQSETSDRPVGNAQWLVALEQRTGRKLQPGNGVRSRRNLVSWHCNCHRNCAIVAP